MSEALHWNISCFFSVANTRNLILGQNNQDCRFSIFWVEFLVLCSARHSVGRSLGQLTSQAPKNTHWVHAFWSMRPGPRYLVHWQSAKKGPYWQKVMASCYGGGRSGQCYGMAGEEKLSLPWKWPGISIKVFSLLTISKMTVRVKMECPEVCNIWCYC